MESQKFSDVPWLRLGTGRTDNSGIGPKAAGLDRAAHAGLPVPFGVIIPHETWRRALSLKLVRVEGHRVSAPDPEKLHAFLRLPDFSGPVAVRSAFSLEDGAHSSLAGFFRSHLFVPPGDVAEFIEALCDVWTSAIPLDEDIRLDLLVMEMVKAEHAGVAFTEGGYEDDLVEYTRGTAQDLVAGQTQGQDAVLPKLRQWEERIPGMKIHEPFLHRLQQLLRDIRITFGKGNWDIEWADNGKVCMVVQVRRITRPLRRNEVFTLANHREILPDLPSYFMTSLIASCAGKLFDYYRNFDPELPEHRPFIEVFYGRPLINLSLLTDMMRAWGLPTRLVIASIGGGDVQPFPWNLRRVMRKLPVLLKLGIAQFRSVAFARWTMNRMKERTRGSLNNFTSAVSTLRWLYSALVTEMFSLTASMSMPMALLRRLGVLEEHSARLKTISTEMYADLEPLREMALKHPAFRRTLQEGRLPADQEFREAFGAYMEKHGHRGIYESDISRKRFHEAPEELLMGLAHPMEMQRKPPRRTLVGLLTLPIWWHARRAVRMREELRYHAMIGFNRIRRGLVTAAGRAAVVGRLPDAQALWNLDVREAIKLDGNWKAAPELLTRRAEERERLAGVVLPDMIHRFDDLESGTGLAPEAGNRFSGVSLTTGDVAGKAWVLREPQGGLPKGFRPEETILVARSIDAGWIPLFAQVAGVVVEIGGDLSHGSIILREIGLPAVTNVSGITKHIATGDRIRLRAGVGVVERDEQREKVQ